MPIHPFVNQEISTVVPDENSSTLEKKYIGLLKSAEEYPEKAEGLLDELRELILLEGIPSTSQKRTSSGCSLRGKLWKILLGVGEISAKEYIALVEAEKSVVYNKIRHDTFRTLVTDQSFQETVKEEELIRVLNAFAHSLDNSSHDSQGVVPKSPQTKELTSYLETNSQSLQFSYVQGMNVLLAPFLYCMPEVDAFFTFKKLLLEIMPMYVQPTMEGVHMGCYLVAEILKVTDPQLFEFFEEKNLKSEVYAFGTVLTLSNCTPPLKEVLKLWDFLFAFGVHLNIVCCVAQLILMKESLLTAPSPVKFLRTYPSIQARSVILLTIQLVQMIPPSLYEQLLQHTKKHAEYPLK